MFNIVTGLVVGVGVFIMRMIDIHKNRQKLKAATETREFQIYKFNSGLMILMFILTIPSAWSAYAGFTTGSDTNAGLGLLLVFLFLSEGIAAIDQTKLYYNETGCVIDNKFIRYKGMKSVRRKYALPFAKHILATYKNEKIAIQPAVSKFLQETQNIPLVHKQD